MKQIQVGSRNIAFMVFYHARRTLAILVKPDCSVEVHSPMGVSAEEIERRVRKRAGWILRQQQYFSVYLPVSPVRRYVGGESYYYLGKQYRLKLIASDKNAVKLFSGYFHVYCADTEDKAHIEQLLLAWYRERAQSRFHEILQLCVKKFREYEISCERVYLRSMPKRWGSCTRAGKISLNSNLIKTPGACIEYVIIHELCHLVEQHHTKSFYELQERIMPDWKRWKARLEEFSAV